MHFGQIQDVNKKGSEKLNLSPGEDEFEENNISDDLNMSRKVSHNNVDDLKHKSIREGISSNE